MSDPPALTPAQGYRLIAAEYVLGVLDPQERRRAQQRLAHDQPFASEVAFWEERLGGFADSVEPIAPPAHTWRRIARSLRIPDPGAPPENLWQSLAFWRSFAIGAAALTAASIGVLTFIEISPPPRPPLVAALAGAAGQPSFLAAVNGGGANLTVVPGVPVPGAFAQHSMELWLIPAGDATPHALGLIEASRPVRLDVPRELAARVTAQAALEVSLEPLGGSKTGLPTGPVVASGKLAGP
jgi:anti-sigma-K factor RskA